MSGDSTRVYHAYGFCIGSGLIFPECLASGEFPDAWIRLGRVDSLSSEASVQGRSFRANARSACLFWKGVGAFRVNEGHEIIVDPAPEVDDDTLRLFTLGPVLGVLLHQRGRLVLHASSVAIEGTAVAFLGRSGSGKSTMAAALMARGHSVMADDITSVLLEKCATWRHGDAEDAGGLAPSTSCHHNSEGCPHTSQTGTTYPTVHPGFPQMKLWPDVARMLGDESDKLTRIRPEIDKRALLVETAFQRTPLSLKRIYVLDEGTTQSIDPLGPQEALVELVRHSYWVRMLDSTTRPMHFLQCGKLANVVPSRRLRVRRSLSSLGELARMVEEDVHAGG